MTLLDQNKCILRPSSMDVAKLAKVSQATVSRVLNSPEKVGEKTREKVYEAIKALNYIPNQNAIGLVSGQSNIITLISGPLENPFFVDSAASIVQKATQDGYKVNIIIANDEDITNSYQLALSNRPEGIIMSCILYEDPIINHLVNLDIPFVSYNRRHKEKLNYVELDNQQAGKMVCEYLVHKNYTSIFWVGGNLSASTFMYRFHGFNEYYQEVFGKPILSEDVCNEPKFNIVFLENRLKLWLKRSAGKRAIACATDAIAIQVLNLTKSMGIKCPEEIGVIGIDNVALASHSYINLTTVGTEEGLGDIAIDSLMEQIKNTNKRNTNITIAPKIFERETTK